MPSDYHIEDLVFQNDQLVVYRVRTVDGSILSLIRLCYEDGIIARLKSGRFDKALQELKSHTHYSPHPVITGGLDPVDSYPWLLISWQESESLQEPDSISTFSEDYHEWFRSAASDLSLSVTPSTPTLSPLPTQSSFPSKSLLLISTLIIGISGSAWFLSQKKDPVSETASQTLETKASTSPVAQTIEKKQAPAPLEKNERPFIQHIKKIKAHDVSAIEANLEKWVALSGTISRIGESGELIFTNSTVNAELLDLAPTAAQGLVNKEVTLTGWLRSSALMEIEELDDLEIQTPPAEQEIFTVSDELYLRKMKGELITLEAQIVGVSTSASKKTLYLLLHKEAPPFSINILRSRLKSGLTSKFLHSLVDKKVHYQGKIGIGSGKGKSKRLSISISKRAQITIVK